MASEDLIEIEGTVCKVLPDGMFRVDIGQNNEVLAYVSGKMRKFFIKIVLGDRVRIQVSPYDLTKGRIIFRAK